MNKVSVTLQARQLVRATECKLNVYRNEVIIKDYKERVEALKVNIASTTPNRSEQARLLRLLNLCLPSAFPDTCKRDAETLRQHLTTIRRRIPSLV